MTLPTLLRTTIQAAILCCCFTPVTVAADPALTIYNQNFAVVRETLPLDLHAGSNTMRFSDATAHLEPDSVILRDPTGKRDLVIIEQNYRADPISQELLLNLYEGKTIDFVVPLPDGSTRVVAGRIVRSGYVPHYQGMAQYGPQYQNSQMAMAGRGQWPAHYRSEREAAILVARATYVSSTGRRFDSKADTRLDHSLQPGVEVRCGVELCDRRYDLERGLQHSGARDGRPA